jgi:hypothetical protein
MNRNTPPPLALRWRATPPAKSLNRFKVRPRSPLFFSLLCAEPWFAGRCAILRYSKLSDEQVRARLLEIIAAEKVILHPSIHPSIHPSTQRPSPSHQLNVVWCCCLQVLTYTEDGVKALLFTAQGGTASPLLFFGLRCSPLLCLFGCRHALRHQQFASHIQRFGECDG